MLRDFGAAAHATAPAARAPVVGAGRVLSPAQNHVRSLAQELTGLSHDHYYSYSAHVRMRRRYAWILQDLLGVALCVFILRVRLPSLSVRTCVRRQFRAIPLMIDSYRGEVNKF